MKKKYFFLCALFMCGACINTDIDLQTETDSQLVIHEDFLMQESFEVPLQSGLVTVVTLDNDTIAITDVPLNIQVPTGASVTRSGGLEVFYVKYGDLPAFEPGSYINDGKYTLYFEDSFKADYDYNDLVLQLKFTVSGGNTSKSGITVNVRGLALGSTKTIGFGFTDLKGNHYILSDDVRRDYFSNQQGFINTVKGKSFVQGIEASDKEDQRGTNYSIVYKAKEKNPEMSGGGYIAYDKINTENSGQTGSNWKNYSFFILVDGGKKLYIASTMKNETESLPYGLITQSERSVYYPIEKMYAGDAFPNFEGWIEGKKNNWNDNPISNNCYTISSSGLWRW